MRTRPRVVLNALALRPGGSGVQTYIRELLRCLPGVVDATLHAVVQADAAGDLPPGVGASRRPVAAGVRRALLGLVPTPAADLVHGLDVDLPLVPRAPTVATVHDLSVFDVPWAFSRTRAAGERFLVRQAVRRADAVIAVSAFTAERVRSLLGREAVVTPLAPPADMAPPSYEDVAAVRARFSLPERFVLHVGTVEPRKDVAGLAEACVQADVPLVLAGALGGAEVPGQARSLGYVARQHLAALYGAATVVAYPSRYEGFGLPPVEALACGAAVVASTVGALPDVLGDAAVLVAPGDPLRLAAAISRLWSDDAERDDLARRARARATTMSWETTAAATAGVYRSLGVPV